MRHGVAFVSQLAKQNGLALSYSHVPLSLPDRNLCMGCNAFTELAVGEVGFELKQEISSSLGVINSGCCTTSGCVVINVDTVGDCFDR